MAIHSFSFNKIKKGERKIDLRLFDKKRQQLKIGDTIEFGCTENNETIMCLVKGIAIFENFEDLVTYITPQSLGYEDVGEVLLRLERLYPLEEQKKFNVVGIFIEDISLDILEKVRDSKYLSL